MYWFILVAYICFTSLVSGADFSKKAAQNGFVMTLCASSNTPKECIESHFIYTYHSRFTADCSDTIFKGTCIVTIAIGNAEDVISVSFKGSAGADNFISNGINELNAKSLADFDSFGKVAADYATAFNRLWDAGLGDTMQELWNDYCEFTVLALGHSTGCCLAQMFVTRMNSLDLFGKEQLVHYGFGCPRCGNQDFAAAVDASSSTLWRVNWIDDNIVNVPATSCARTAAAKSNSGTTCWFHCCKAALAKKAFIINTLSFTTCAVGESTTCTAGSKSSAHYNYWDISKTNYDNLVCDGTTRIFTVDV